MKRFNRTTLPAFTLTEMMVVLAIIGLIAAIVGPRLFNRLDDAKRRTAHLQITQLVSAVDLYRIDTGRLPTREEGLDILIHPPTDGSEWLGPYLAKDRIPPDPWGHTYLFESDPVAARFTITSYGSDGAKGGPRQRCGHQLRYIGKIWCRRRDCSRRRRAVT